MPTKCNITRMCECVEDSGVCIYTHTRMNVTEIKPGMLAFFSSQSELVTHEKKSM